MKLGQKYTCFECGTKFYDLERPAPICPRCGVDQRLAPGSEYARGASERRRRSGKSSGESEPQETSNRADTVDDLDDAFLEDADTDYDVEDDVGDLVVSTDDIGDDDEESFD